MGLKELHHLVTGTRTLACLIVAGVALTACAQDANGEIAEADDGATNDADIPSIYIDRRIVHLDRDGKNGLHEGYRLRLSLCQEAGLARPLSEADEALIGTERWQFWRLPGRLAYRVESWGDTSGDGSPEAICRFSLQRSGYHEYFDTGKQVFVDFGTGEREVLPPDPDVLDTTLYEADDEALAGGGGGWSGPLEQAVQGQPCMEWRSPNGGTVCIWSGGGRWGFEHYNPGLFMANTGFNTRNIVLAAEPEPGRHGVRLTTEQFVIDGTFDPADMSPGATGDGG